MQVTCTQKFPFNVGGKVNTYRPGNLIEDTKAAQWALENGYGREVKPRGKAKQKPDTGLNKAAPDVSENKAQ